MESVPTAPAEGSAPAPASVASSAPAAATPPPETNNRVDVKALMRELTPAQRLLAASGKLAQITPAASSASAAPATPSAPSAPKAEATAPAEAPVSSAPIAPAAPATAPEQGIEDENSDAADGSSEGKTKKRYRFTDEKDQAVVAFAKANGLNLMEAAQRLAAASAPAQGQTAPGTTATQSPAAPAAEPAPDPQVVAYDGQIAETAKRLEKLTADRAKAIDDLDSAKVATLSDEIADLRADKKLLERDKANHVRQQEDAVQNGFKQQVQASREKAFEQFPKLADTESMERLALDAFTKRAREQRPDFFRDVNWPQKLVAEFAQLHGLKGNASEGTAPAAPAAPAPAAPARPGIQKSQPKQVPNGAPNGSKLLTGSDGRSSSAPSAATRDDVLAFARTNPGAAIKALSQLNAGRR